MAYGHRQRGRLAGRSVGQVEHRGEWQCEPPLAEQTAPREGIAQVLRPQNGGWLVCRLLVMRRQVVARLAQTGRVGRAVKTPVFFWKLARMNFLTIRADEVSRRPHHAGSQPVLQPCRLITRSPTQLFLARLHYCDRTQLPTAPRFRAYGSTRLRLPTSHLKLKSQNQKTGATSSDSINQSTA